MKSPAEEFLDRGDVAGAVQSATEAVRENPDSVVARRLLCHLFCLTGSWERATKQLNAWAALKPDDVASLLTCERLLAFERQRHAAFAGTSPASILGEQRESVQTQSKILQLWFSGRAGEAADLANGVSAPVVQGEINGAKFAGLEDLDSRFGQLLEVFSGRGYGLVPISEIEQITAAPPTSYLDVVWRPVTIQRAGEVQPAYIPTRYPGSETAADAQVQLARKTEVEEPFPGFFIATGQRVFLTGDPEGEVDILSLASLQIHPHDPDGHRTN